MNGQQIPLPEGFTQEECSWIVSPNLLKCPQEWGGASGLSPADAWVCQADSNRYVKCYVTRGSYGSPISGYANYIIIGIKK